MISQSNRNKFHGADSSLRRRFSFMNVIDKKNRTGYNKINYEIRSVSTMETGDGSTNSGGRSLRCGNDADVPLPGRVR